MDFKVTENGSGINVLLFYVCRDAEMRISHKMQTSFEKLCLIFASNIATHCPTWLIKDKANLTPKVMLFGSKNGCKKIAMVQNMERVGGAFILISCM